MNWWDRLWRHFDRARLFPRVAVTFYMWQMYHVAEWAMHEKDISNAEAAFVATVYGAFPLLLNFYMQQGTDWGKALHDDSNPDR